MRFFLLMLSLLVINNVYSQCSNTFRYALRGTGTDAAYDIQEIAGGDLIIGGQTNSFGAGGFDFFLTRMTKTGNIVWSKTFGGTADETIRKMRLSRDGNLLITGQTRSFGHPTGHCVAMKIDVNGNVIWSVTLSEGSETTLGVDIYSAADNSTLVSGSSYRSSNISDWMVAKIDGAGNLVWFKRLDGSFSEDVFSVAQKGDTLIVVGDSSPASEYEIVMAKLSFLDGTLYETNASQINTRGAFSSNMQYSSGQYRINTHLISGNSYAQKEEGFVILDTATLSPIKTFKINAPSSYTNNYFTGFFQTADGGFIASASPSAFTESYLYKFDQQSNLVATHRYSSSQSLALGGATEDSDGAIWLVGSEGQDAVVMKLNADGEFEHCTNEQVQGTTTPTTINTRPFNWISEALYPAQLMANTPAISDFTFRKDSLCTVQYCGNAQITGPAISCNLADSLTYTASNGGMCAANWQWMLPPTLTFRIVNDSTIRVIAATGGNYNIIVENMGGCTVQRDTLSVTITPSPRRIDLGNDTILCNTASLVLDAGAGFTSYQWQDNSTGQTFTVSNPGTYNVSARNACNETFSDMMQVRYRLPSDVSVYPMDTAYCATDVPIRFSASGGDLYQWNPATYLSDPQISNPVGTPDASIIYTVTITDTVCNYSSNLEVNVTVNTAPDIQLSKSNDLNCAVAFSQLSATGADRYEWLPDASLSALNIANPVANPSKTTTYTVKAYGIEGCVSEDSITVYFEKTGMSDIYLPTGFTPNGDGRNDIFRVVATGAVTLKEFSIFNRWGNLVFTSNNVSRGWNGTVNGILQEPGAYYWFVKATNACEGELFRKGHVILIR